MGGTCLNVGCIPSKALLNISHKYLDASKHFKGFGLEVSGVNVNWTNVQKKKTDIVNSLTRGIVGLYGKNKVEYVKGWGKITDKNTVSVNMSDNTTKTLSAKHIIIATGSEPAPFPGLPFDEKVIISSTGALSLEKIPKKLVVIGGGVIGLELGSVYQRFGTEVTVVEFLDRIIPAADVEISKNFLKILNR